MLEIEEELINNITNQESTLISNINFWNYLLFKSRKNTKTSNLLTNTTQPQLQITCESKCLIKL